MRRASKGAKRWIPWGWVAACVASCGGEGPSDPVPDAPLVPPPGPHFSVSPIPLDSIARISPLGPNNKILPVGHSYWDTCDANYLLNTGRPCLHANLELRAPGSGRVFSIDPADDGQLTVEGPPGLMYSFAHVTPAPGLSVGDTVQAGDVIARMFYTHSFDFGVVNPRVEHVFVRPERYPPPYLHAQHPLALYPADMRRELESRVSTRWDEYDRLSFDVEGTAAGNWFKAGTPVSDQALTTNWVHAQLFLGPLAEHEATRIVVIGDRWSGMPNRLAVVDAADRSWDAVTPSSGVVAMRLWGLTQDGEPNTEFPHGSLLVEMVDSTTLRIEWFEGHEASAGFTAQARTYERE